MGRSNRRRQGAESRRIVAFDFDGTLTYRDSFLSFLAWRSGRAGYLAGLARLAPAAAAYVFDRDRGRLKAAAVRVFLRGLPRKDLLEACAAFAASPAGSSLIRPDAEHCWRQWKSQGARLAIVSASPEEVVAPFAKLLDADVLIATRLALGPDARVAGGFEGENCRGPEKARRIRSSFGTDVRLAAAYGDTSGDREMLAMADVKGYRVFKDRP